MQDKQKVTLYLSPDLHRRLKIQSAVDAEPMSSLVERAMSFYLEHPGIEDVVEAAHGHTHQVYQCPACTSSVVLRDGEMVALEAPSNLLKDTEENLTVKQGHKVGSSTDQPGEELVPC